MSVRAFLPLDSVRASFSQLNYLQMPLHGLGAVLLQENGGEWKPVAYASRSMSETEKRYAQIEKEALATAWACDKFANYIIGLKIIIETDHSATLWNQKP